MSALDKQGSSVWRYKKKGLDVLLMFVFYKAIISELLLFFNKSFFLKKQQVFLNFLCNYAVLKTDPMLMSHYSYRG